MKFPTSDEDLASLLSRVTEFEKTLKARAEQRELVTNKASELSKEFTSVLAAFVKEANKPEIQLKTSADHNVFTIFIGNSGMSLLAIRSD